MITLYVYVISLYMWVFCVFVMHDIYVCIIFMNLISLCVCDICVYV